MAGAPTTLGGDNDVAPGVDGRTLRFDEIAVSARARAAVLRVKSCGEFRLCLGIQLANSAGDGRV